jgi:hypothetical protein
MKIGGLLEAVPDSDEAGFIKMPAHLVRLEIDSFKKKTPCPEAEGHCSCSLFIF